MKIKQSIFFFLSLLTTTICTKAQAPDENLIYNSDFESYQDCPRRIDALGILTIVDAWFQPTNGSADYFNVCGMKECFVPNNKLGIQDPHSGNGYCGIYCSKTEYREYLQTQLKRKLKEGEKYRLTFHVSLSEYSSGAVATIGAVFSEYRLFDTVKSVLMKKEERKINKKITQTTSTYYTPQVVNNHDNVLINTKGWDTISGEFIAKGGEEYLTIGNFFPASHSNVIDLDSLTYLLPGAYYYIDDVTLYCLTCKPPYNPPKDTTKYKVGSTFVLKNIFFEFDKSNILQQSYKELQQLIELLTENPNMKIEIGGHTDDKGTIEYNQRLSENRANAVVKYLINKGISEKRLKYKGYGELHPIDTNETEAGRFNNRRVEFKILDI
ncbi:MAG: OmpA family protein [Bacteroidales bacterium]|nr:OmpA family protein [Bacteroidales bacterium]